MNLYFAAGIGIAFATLVAVSEVRIAYANRATVKAEQATVEIQQRFADYQQQAAAELIREADAQQKAKAQHDIEVSNVRKDYAARLAAIRGVRGPAIQATGAADGGTLPGASGPERRAVDGTADGATVSRCFPSDRVDAILIEAEINTAKLIACQNYRR